MSKCNKWKTECNKCPNLKCYPKELFDTTKKEYKLKKKLFTDLNNLTITTPSIWLKELVKESFLKQYDVKVVNNGIDLNIFKPTYDEKIYKKYNIPKDKKVILGVANIWEERKGLNVFLKLSDIIEKDEVIVLVGLTEKQIEVLPKNIIGIKRTDNQKELAVLYTISDIFINPSIEETFSLVTVEAMACGKQVTVCGTSAPKELIDDNIGISIEENKAINYYEAYKKIKEKKITESEVVKYAKKYSNEQMLKKIMEVYGVK
jgi:glycosyltransferase involved in cell wall biosynthesis